MKAALISRLSCYLDFQLQDEQPQTIARAITARGIKAACVDIDGVLPTFEAAFEECFGRTLEGKGIRAPSKRKAKAAA